MQIAADLTVWTRPSPLTDSADSLLPVSRRAFATCSRTPMPSRNPPVGEPQTGSTGRPRRTIDQPATPTSTAEPRHNSGPS